MGYKTQQYLVLTLVLILMIGVGVMLNKMQGITGAAVAPIEQECSCTTNLDCDDSNPCTSDTCINPDDCSISTCSYTWIC